jgi:dihydrofolate reductase
VGRTTYWMNASLDLRIEHAAGEQGGGSWLRIGEQLHRDFNVRARALDLMIQGRVIFETMEGFWPKAAHDSSMPDFMQEYGQIWTEKPKVLLSNTRTKADYSTRIIGGPHAMAELATVITQTPGTIGVGGATVATSLLKQGLLDELLLFVHPVVLGSGRPLFDELTQPLQCDLLEQATFEDGVTLKRLAIRK